MIRAEVLSAGYDKFRVREINLAPPAGEFCALSGPNGSGKSTLIKVLGGVLRPFSGSVAAAGKEVYSISAKARGRIISHVPPEFQSEFPFTVREIVAMGLYPRTERFEIPGSADKKKVEEALSLAGCDGFADKKINEISSGQRRLVLLSRAVCQDTPVMLLDEPAAHRDPVQASRIFRLLSLLTDEGKTVFAVTHDLGAVTQYCDRVVFMKNGTLAAAGRPEEIITGDILREVYGGPFSVRNIEGGVYVRTE